MEGGCVVSEREAQRWFKHVSTGEENTKDLPHLGVPKLCDIENICNVLEENPLKRTRRLSQKLRASKDTVLRQMKTFGKSYRSCRLLPSELTS